ncbi:MULTISPECIES: hypothetical protein [Burkholderia]|jgi:hypothetical protein|uniref:Uncharacterized protein n=2 Tax=Burkholderia cepacia complex TaxID=87882 RepID=A0A250LPC7_9BURK|nr:MULTISPECIES: hypothetical protein [Burkholderia]MBA9833694.1 hypothetical protein [Burkholderia contaminans]MBA9909590.1 hypothetical protein [Burkholderia contaminans]MBR8290421.1 hypothetical protein [Burkholderia cenocepacia]MBX3826576.1 hypothetical protein [Burkholderia contaminans]MBX3845591.1 hypothetical protein [Burkholderia contaminans]
MNAKFDGMMERLLGPKGVRPSGQTNASVGGGLVMRTGLPHRGGRLAIHAFESGYPVMVSANAYFNPKTGQACILITPDSLTS